MKNRFLTWVVCSAFLFRNGFADVDRREHEGLWNGYDRQPRLTKAQQLGTIHPAGPSRSLRSADTCYFEIARGAQVGNEVVGRVQLSNNSYESATFKITGGNGQSYFRIKTVANSRGKHSGVIELRKDGLKKPSYALEVEAHFAGGVVDTQTYTIHLVDELLADRLFEWKFEEYTRHHRLTRTAPDQEIHEHLKRMQADGTFSDLPLAMNREGWFNTCASAERLLKFGCAYWDEDSRFFQDDALKAALYRGILANARQNEKFRTDWADTHVWRNSDFIAGIGIRFFRTLKSEMKSPDLEEGQLALEVYDAILDVCDVLWAERMKERPAIGNANRNHRMRSLITRAAISYDYNRALTDQDIWYDREDPRIPGFYPDGCIGDVMELIETSFVLADTYNNQNGFFPDGTICHHPRVGIQFTADAYGWEWLTENSIPMAHLLKDSPYRANDSLYNTIADRILSAYRPFTYQGYLDPSVGGLLPDRSKWGPRILKAVRGLLAARSSETVIQQQEELLEYARTLEKNQFRDALSLNQAFWNVDSLVHRRGDFISSYKMVSTRSRGLERGVDRRSYYYLGDGALFVRRDAGAYNGISSGFNWHAVPGTTAEQRLDALPLAADSPFPGAHGTHPLAGVVSDGRNGFGAFVYERNHPEPEVNYSTVNAHKGSFFIGDRILALGNHIRRVRPGDGQAIWTILNQDHVRGPFVYMGGEQAKSQALDPKPGQVIRLSSREPVWFHHDRIGYVILPTERPVDCQLRVEGGGEKPSLFTLLINHGNNPLEDRYAYILLPNVSAEDVDAFVQGLSQDPVLQVLRNDSGVMAVYHKDRAISQVAFFESGEINLPSLSGKPLQLRVDRPAFIMLEEKPNQLKLTVTDPYHSTEEGDTLVTLNRHLRGAQVHADPDAGFSKVIVGHSLEEVYAGRPVAASLQVVQH